MNAKSLAHCAATATPAPTTTLALTTIDPDGTLSTALQSNPGEVWLIRPDAHIAATLPHPTPNALTTAIRRASGHPPTTA
nr:hypothetical protein [Nocardia terpenica]